MTRVLALIALLLALVAPPAAAQTRPNIVFVLTDDLSWNLLPYMPQVQAAAARRGRPSTSYFVTDSLCCPSRASIFTGRYPHSTGVLQATAGDDGGFGAFHASGEEAATFATALQARRLPHRADGQVPQRLPPVRTRRRRAPVTSRRAGRRGRSAATATASSTTTCSQADGRPGADRPLRQRAAGLPDRRDRRARAGSSSPTPVADAQAVPARAVRRTRRTRRTRPRRATPTASPALLAPRTPLFDAAQLSDAPAWLATTPRFAGGGRGDRPRLPQARAVRPGRRPHDRRAARPARRARRRPATPTSSSAPTTASTWASGGCWRASRPPGITTSACR